MPLIEIKNQKLKILKRIGNILPFLGLLTLSCQKQPQPILSQNTSIGTLARNVTSSLDSYRLVSSDDIGLIGDGVFNNTQIINNFLRNASNVKLVLKKGVYIVDGIVIASDNFALIGYDSELRASNLSNSKSMIEVWAKNVGIYDVTIDGSANTNLTDGVLVYKQSGTVLSGITATNFPGRGIHLSSSNDISVNNCTVNNCGDGILFWGGDARTSPGIGTSGIRVTGCHVSNIQGGGIWGSDGDNIDLENNIVSSIGDVGIDLEGVTHAKINNNNSSLSNYGAISLFYRCSGILITNNQVGVNNGKAGIRITNSPGNLINYVFIDGNTIQADNSYGVLLDQQGSEHIEITNNHINGNYAFPIRSINCNYINIGSNSIHVSNCTYGISSEGGSHTLVRWNELVTNQTQQESNQSAALLIPWFSPQFPSENNVILGNLVHGFDVSILAYRGPDDDSSNSYSGNYFEYSKKTSTLNLSPKNMKEVPQQLTSLSSRVTEPPINKRF